MSKQTTIAKAVKVVNAEKQSRKSKAKVNRKGRLYQHFVLLRNDEERRRFDL